MSGKPAEASSLPKETRTKRPLGPSRPDQAALTSGVIQLRDALIRRLEQIETLALEQTSLLQKDASEREQELNERVASLEAAQARLIAEAKRREQEWQIQSQQLESDRSLLAESWERLEQERIDSPNELATPRVATVERAAMVSEAAKTYRPSGADESDDPVTRAVMRQFQALKSDVRNNSKGRGGR